MPLNFTECKTGSCEWIFLFLFPFLLFFLHPAKSSDWTSVWLENGILWFWRSKKRRKITCLSEGVGRSQQHTDTWNSLRTERTIREKNPRKLNIMGYSCGGIEYWNRFSTFKGPISGLSAGGLDRNNGSLYPRYWQESWADVTSLLTPPCWAREKALPLVC